jgi:antitoxin component of MazEF toxin-antitoxin module
VGWFLRIRCHRGNSKGMIIPAALLEQAGLESEADVSVEEGALIVRAPAKSVRSGWAEAAYPHSMWRTVHPYIDQKKK